MWSAIRKWMAVVLVMVVILAASGCSFHKVRKWFEKLEWEKDDETVRIVDLFVK